MPARSAWPGRGLVSGAFLAWPARSAAGTGSGDIAVSHLGHSVLATLIATGPPSVTPCRTPPVISASSCSNFIRAPRPYPARRRASAAAMSAVVTSTPAGMPSQIATSARPCDSPAVSQCSMLSILPWSRPRMIAWPGDSDREAAAQPPAELPHQRAPQQAGCLVAGRQAAAGGQRQLDLQVAALTSAGAGRRRVTLGHAEPRDRGLARHGGRHRAQHIRILV